MKTYHLLHDLGVYKQLIKRNFEDNDRDKEYDDVRDLLARRTQRYTIPELERLFGFLWTAHDDCVLDNCDEYSALQFYTAQKKVEAGEEAYEKLKALKEAENAPDSQSATQSDSAH